MRPALTLFFSLVAMISCQKKHEFTIGTLDHPIQIHGAIDTTALDYKASAKKLISYLQDQTDLFFELGLPMSKKALLQGLVHGHIHMSALDITSYINLQERKKLNAILTLSRGGEMREGPYVVVHQSSPVKRLSQLNGQSFTYSMASPLRTQIGISHLFKENNVFLGEIRYEEDEIKIIRGLLKKRIFAASLSYSTINKILNLDRNLYDHFPERDLSKEIQIISRGRAMAKDPLVVSSSIPDFMREKIKQALLKLKKDQRGREVLSHIFQTQDIHETSDLEYRKIKKLFNLK